MDMEIQPLNINYKIINNFLDKDMYENIKYFYIVKIRLGILNL